MSSTGGEARLRRVPSDRLTSDEVAAIRALMAVAFGEEEGERFDDDDWAHAIGGVHVVLDVDGVIVAHASVVEREIHVAGRPLRTGYVEAVATDPARQGRRLGTRVMTEVGAILAAEYELGVLGTGAHHFYERLGWRTWRGPAFVRAPQGDRRTPDDEGSIMVLVTSATPDLTWTDPISCDWRPGDVW
ncbi:MAG TPA: GNAT family N-acetyltransferase [Candidatus Limnocylindrales bacterium]|nr:GNAT family N-acetyltransferase [Candidatus Limnocylindrales bacterium]